jgi:hypothetical protein
MEEDMKIDSIEELKKIQGEVLLDLVSGGVSFNPPFVKLVVELALEKAGVKDISLTTFKQQKGVTNEKA